jgi:hypothetical protein
MLTEYFLIGVFAGLLIDGFFFLSERANQRKFCDCAHVAQK